jgi:hypothetical protein
MRIDLRRMRLHETRVPLPVPVWRPSRARGVCLWRLQVMLLCLAICPMGAQRRSSPPVTVLSRRSAESWRLRQRKRGCQSISSPGSSGAKALFARTPSARRAPWASPSSCRARPRSGPRRSVGSGDGDPRLGQAARRARTQVRQPRTLGRRLCDRLRAVGGVCAVMRS